MHEIRGCARDYAWGSPSVIPAYFGKPPAEMRVAELWLGAHPDGQAAVVSSASMFDDAALYPSRVSSSDPGVALGEWIAQDPQKALGQTVIDEHGPVLPYLLKIIAPNEPLSLQVHPTIDQAIEGYEREDRQGIERSAGGRNYKDHNHKPELVYALSTFEALAGFRAPRRIRDVLSGLGTPLTERMCERLRTGTVNSVFSELIGPATAPSPEEVHEVARACAARLEDESPSPRADRIVGLLAERYPGDPGVVASLLMNPVTLKPGETLFVSAGTIHAYLKGVAVEIMAASDNVLRAGLTAKKVDVPEFLKILNTSASPPTRIAPERMSRAVSTFYAPVDDFELSSIHLKDSGISEKIKGAGPRTIVCLRGAAILQVPGQAMSIRAGQAVFVPACDGPLSMRGVGHLVQAAVP